MFLLPPFDKDNIKFEQLARMEELPYVVVEKLLNYLDFYDRLTLRLVCKTTQNWIDSSKVIGSVNDDPLLKVLDNCVHHPATVQDFIYDGRHPWPGSRLSIPAINHFPIDPLCQIGSAIRFLTIQSFSGSPSEISFLSCCTNLQSLSIGTLDLSSKQDLVVIIEAALVKDIFCNLEHFHIEKIAVLYPPDFTLVNYLKKMLNLMSNLKTLKIPEVVESTGKAIEPGMHFSLHLGFVVGPLMAYLNERSKDSSSNLTALDLTHIDAQFSSFFKEILKPCGTMKTRVYNVNYKLIKLACDEDKSDFSLLKCIHSVRNKFEGALITLNELKNVRSISIDCDCVPGSAISSTTPTRKSVKKQHLLPLPFLKHAELCLWSETQLSDFCDEQKMDKQAFESILFTHERPNLRQLVLVGKGRSHLIYNFSQVIEKFGNVTVLKVLNFPKFTNEDFRVVLKNMRKLQTLEIEDEWGALSDVGITTPAQDNTDNEHPYELLTLKSLVKLKITGKYKYTGGFYPQGQSYRWHWSRLEKFCSAPNQNFISDYSFKEVFSRMKLRSFLVQTADIHITKLAYYFLLKGDFAAHVEYFPHPDYLPLGLTSSEFYDIRREFKHFREEIRSPFDCSSQQQFSPIVNYPSDFRPKDGNSSKCFIS